MTVPFFLFLGESDREGATSKIKAAGWEYKKKRLESGVENWKTIIELIDSPRLTGVVAKLTSTTFGLMASDSYADVASELLAKIRHVPHVVFVHESLISGVAEEIAVDDDGPYQFDASYFELPPRAVLDKISALLDEHEINVVGYRKNVELGVLAASFVDRNEQNLIFRMYVPAGRLWSAETEKILQLFRDYLGKIGGLRVRQDQHTTNHGTVYEFFGDHAIDPTTLPEEFDRFATLLDLCVSSPAEAAKVLVDRLGDNFAAQAIVDRYAKEAKRLQVDLKHERERKLLSIRHRLESELVDVISEVEDWAAINAIADALIPRGTVSAPMGLLSQGQSDNRPITVNIRPQIISAVGGVVAQEISGTVKLGTEAVQILELIRKYGGGRSAELASALYEVEDADAKQSDRIVARQNIKSFLLKVGAKLGDVGFGVLQTYIESKLGL